MGLHAAILAAMGVGVCVLDGRQRVVLHNPCFVAMFGADVPAHASIDSLVDPRDLPAFHGLLASTEAGGGEPCDLRLRRADEQERWVSVSKALLPPDVADCPGRVVLTLHEVTERKAFEREALDAEDRLTAFLDASSALAWMKSKDGSFVHVNAAWERVLGADPHSVPDPAPLDDGTVAWHTVRFPFWDASGNEYAAGIALDVTAERSAREALRRTEEQLRQSQKMDALGRLAGGVAHDFNNLLGVISGYAGVIAQEVGRDHPAHGAVTEVIGAVETAASLTRQLLTFSREQTTAPTVLDVNAVLRSSERMLRPLLAKDVEVVCDLQPEVGSVLADSANLHQVVMNLVVNARDAMPRGGTLTIRSSSLVLTDAHCPGCAVRGRAVRISVSDTGTGMDDATMARIYEPFFTTKTVGKGTGLGLATVFGIVKQSGGCIHVERRVGHGTRFDIGLPSVEPTTSATSRA